MKTWNYYLQATIEIKADNAEEADREALQIMNSFTAMSNTNGGYKAWFEYTEMEEVTE